MVQKKETAKVKASSAKKSVAKPKKREKEPKLEKVRVLTAEGWKRMQGFDEKKSVKSKKNKD